MLLFSLYTLNKKSRKSTFIINPATNNILWLNEPSISFVILSYFWSIVFCRLFLNITKLYSWTAPMKTAFTIFLHLLLYQTFTADHHNTLIVIYCFLVAIVSKLEHLSCLKAHRLGLGSILITITNELLYHFFVTAYLFCTMNVRLCSCVSLN